MTEIASGNGPSSVQKRRKPAGDFKIAVLTLCRSSKEGIWRRAPLAFDIAVGSLCCRDRVPCAESCEGLDSIGGQQL